MEKRSKNIDDRKKAVLEFLREIYNEKVASYAVFPEYMGEIDDPDGYARVTGPCGDSIEFFLQVKGGIIEKAGFLVDGCTTTVATANAAIHLVLGKSLMTARSITQEKILEALGGLPERDQHCALLAANTMKAVVHDVQKTLHHPWKKFYRKR